MSLLRILLLMFGLLAIGGLINGCGNKGPLYLPDDRAENGK
ncbi:MAG TPA: lipoprotein [Gammaproteobacteria bacterium]